MAGRDTMSPAKWEALCDGCGACCRIPNTQYACKGLDVETKRCTVYNKRHQTYPCLSVTPYNVLDLHERGILPASCAYVRHEKGQPQQEPPEYVLVPYEMATPTIKHHFRVDTKHYLKARAKTSSK
jgi:uncharacterized cysteine cluster protein YcgN (CxxCxxCC family)